MTLFRRVAARARKHPWWATTIVAGAALGFIVVHHFFFSGSSEVLSADNTSHVRVSSVAMLSASAGPLSIVGTVKSQSQATILAQSAGEVTQLYRSIGDRVAAGTIIGTFENSGQRAAVTQAQGQYESAQAALAKAQGATAANSGISSSQAQTAVQNSAAALSAALASAYAALDDAVHTKADTLLNNPRTPNPTLIFLAPDIQLTTTILNERPLLEDTLSDANRATSATDLDEGARAMLADAQRTQAFLNNLITALNKTVPSANFSAATISADQATLAAARTEVNTAVSALTAAKAAYDSAVASAQSASNSASTGTQSDIASAQASLKSAQGGLDAARAALEKTIIRSPISGTIVSLPITQGDFVSAFSQVAIVSNPGALYVDAQVTQDDAHTLAVGSRVLVNSSIEGVITFVAPALDPTTGKIGVKVGLTGDMSALSDGQAVTLALTRSQAPTPTKNTAAISIPIIAAKILPTGPIVFSVSTSSTLIAHQITLGTILGNQVVVSSGLTPDMHIVTDTRGLSEGQTVVVDTSETSTQ